LGLATRVKQPKPGTALATSPALSVFFPQSRPALMNRLFRSSSLSWLALIGGAVLLLFWINARRIAEIERISQLEAGAAADDTSPTGYVRGTRNLILPEKTPSGQPWVMDVQKMLAAGAVPVKHTDYDNAPEGRPIQGASPYRGWLRLIARLEVWLGGYSPGRAVERAVLHANPLVHGLLCLGAGLFVAWRFGAATGGLLALGIAVLFPLTGLFAPGQPDDHGLLLGANLVSLLLILAGIQAGGRAAGCLCFALAGTAAGFGLWLDASTQAVALSAVWTGGLLAVWLAARPVAGAARPPALPWRWWVAGGTVTALLGWLVEGHPGGLVGVNLDTNHPLTLLAWAAGAEVLVRLHAWRQDGVGRVGHAAMAGALAILILVPGWLIHKGGNTASFGPDGTGLGAFTTAENLTGWIGTDGLSPALLATVLPLLLGGIAIWQLRKNPATRQALAVALGTVGILLLFSLVQLRWWGLLDSALLGLFAIVTTGLPAGLARLWWRLGLILMLIPGFVLSWPKTTTEEKLSPAQARILIERDLAQWLSARSEPGTIALAPPALSASLCYYGGLRVVASPFPGNQDGLTLAVRIAAATSTDEAQALVQRRGIQYLIVPSWDGVLDEFARIGSDKPERSLIALLRQWLPPRWLRPVAYQMPVVPGLENDSLAVFEVVEPQENAVALSRLAEYFVETGRLELAAAVGDSLEKAFASDAGALIARAQVALARNENRTLARIIPELLSAIADGKDEDLSWERRTSLAIVLAQIKRTDQARGQAEFSLKEADVDRLRSLGPVTLFRLLTLARAFRLEFAHPDLQRTALELLPTEYRAQLQR
jgi:hypothetical protein